MSLYPDKLEGGLMDAQQLASGLVQAYFLAMEADQNDKDRATVPLSAIHFHDASSSPIAWNDVQAILYANEKLHLNLPVPLTATEGNNQHYHSSPYDGGYIGVIPHSHQGNLPGQGGFAFAVFHPGTALPSQPFAL